MLSCRALAVGVVGVLLASPARAANWPKDLNPVTIKPAPKHAPVVLVEKGQPRGSIAVMNPRLSATAQQLQQFIHEATGAKVPILQGKITTPAIVIGHCDLGRQHGPDVKKLPVEGFVSKTMADHVLIAGGDEEIVPGQARSDGTAWGVTEFLERFVGVRWYFPGDLGRSVPKSPDLHVPPVWLEDAPVFRLREIWPPTSDPWRGKGTQLTPLHTFLRSGNSWPNRLVVHSPDWSRIEDYRK